MKSGTCSFQLVRNLRSNSTANSTAISVTSFPHLGYCNRCVSHGGLIACDVFDNVFCAESPIDIFLMVRSRLCLTELSKYPRKLHLLNILEMHRLDGTVLFRSTSIPYCIGHIDFSFVELATQWALMQASCSPHYAGRSTE